MWELVESIVYLCKSKKWPLPLFIVVILILLTFAWSFLSVQKSQELPPPIVQSVEIPVAITPPPSVPVVRAQAPIKKHAPKIQEEPEVSFPLDDAPVQQTGNVQHFRETLIDRLKVEGLDPLVADKIFKHIRSQLDIKDPNYELADSIRAVMPDLSDGEVYQMRDLVSRIMTESSNYMKDR